ncbi:hypothetical protein IPL68_04605 [Candidatus Saccharibacteria bacterium]|nr:MAG: hypothetical protein IPL68_04605 [Candidatus Saccharibacteria bacterium]
MRHYDESQAESKASLIAIMLKPEVAPSDLSYLNSVSALFALILLICSDLYHTRSFLAAIIDRPCPFALLRSVFSNAKKVHFYWQGLKASVTNIDKNRRLQTTQIRSLPV